MPTFPTAPDSKSFFRRRRNHPHPDDETSNPGDIPTATTATSPTLSISETLPPPYENKDVAPKNERSYSTSCLPSNATGSHTANQVFTAAAKTGKNFQGPIGSTHGRFATILKSAADRLQAVVTECLQAEDVLELEDTIKQLSVFDEDAKAFYEENWCIFAGIRQVLSGPGSPGTDSNHNIQDLKKIAELERNLAKLTDSLSCLQAVEKLHVQNCEDLTEELQESRASASELTQSLHTAEFLLLQANKRVTGLENNIRVMRR